jgi:hypothetical protein
MIKSNTVDKKKIEGAVQQNKQTEYLGPSWSKKHNYSEKMQSRIKKYRKHQEKIFKEEEEKKRKEKKEREKEYEMLSPWDNNKILYNVYDKIINADHGFQYKTFKDYIYALDNNLIEDEELEEKQNNSSSYLYSDEEVNSDSDFIEYYSDDYSDSENEY